MKLRTATVEDAQALAELVVSQPLLARYGTTVDGLARGLRAGLEAGDGVVIAEDAAPQGFAWYQLAGGFGLGGYLKLIALAPGAEGRGLGGQLLDEVERAVALHRRHLMLLVSDFNQGAQRFYERRGYVQSGRLKQLVRPDIDELLYVKKL